MRKRFLVLSISVAVVAALAAGAMRVRQQRTAALEALPPPEPAPWALRTAVVERRSLSRGFPVLATLAGSRDITLSAQVAGTVLMMGPREGVAVQAGELLARIDVRELLENRDGLRAQLKSARADVIRTRDEYQRQQQLIKKGLTSTELAESRRTAWVNAQQKVNGLEKQISALEVRIGYGEVRAPTKALVAARPAEPGDAVQPGKPLYRLTVDTTARLRVKLPQQVLEQVHPGTPVELSYGNKQALVKLDRVFPDLDNHALGAAEADLDALPFGLRSGTRIPARVVTAQVSDVLAVPHTALVGTGDRGYVFAVRDGRLHKVRLRVLLDARQALAVTGDLTPGERVVSAQRSILLRLRDGDPVVTEPTGA